jgi:hypothetical protein
LARFGRVGHDTSLYLQFLAIIGKHVPRLFRVGRQLADKGGSNEVLGVIADRAFSVRITPRLFNSLRMAR